MFTPALVLDGTSMVIGSDRAAVETAIAAAGTLPVTVTLSRSGDGMAGDGMAEDGMAVEIGAGAGQMQALRIVYDVERATAVAAGENRGERLHEYRIVREVETLAEWAGGARRFTAKLPGPRQGQAILVQTADLRIVGAADQAPA